ncbi:AAA family ATPase [Thiobacter sp. AK1]|uniref:AAA family ATPase n=1 Tax=Thiobacter aerophilum TaxID=3121275 RepID=A0ABV0EEF6_9BURK
MPVRLAAVLRQVGEIVLGKEREIRLACACLLARGHLLIEDLPGMGKTTLAQALARTLGLAFNRIQFTADLLPADIVGVSVWDRQENRFVFHSGPVFAQVVVADEINRATPKAQSALLEAMEERQVTVDGITRRLPEPFFVIATQNPQHQVGTFPLPESQLDRFLMRLSLGYPEASAERALLAGTERRTLLAQLSPLFDAASLITAQEEAARLFVAEALLDYVQALLAHSRSGPYGTGLSPRAGRGLVQAARAHAYLCGRAAVLPEDVQAVLPAVAGHRLHDPAGAQSGEELAAALLAAVPLP